MINSIYKSEYASEQILCFYDLQVTKTFNELGLDPTSYLEVKSFVVQNEVIFRDPNPNEKTKLCEIN